MNAAPEAPTTSPTHDRCMGYARQLDAEWATLVQALDTLRKSTADMEMTAVLGLHSRDFEPPDAYHYRSRVFRRVTDYATVALSPTRTPLTINTDDLRDRFIPDRGFGERSAKPPADFSAEAVMAAVLAAAEPNAEAEGLRQLADRLYRNFERNAARTVRGCTVLTLSAWTHQDKFSDHAQYTYDTRRQIQETLDRLAEAFPRLGAMEYPPAVATGMVAVCTRQFYAADWKASRSFRAQLGPIEIRTFQRKVEFHVPDALAQALNLFISMHRTPTTKSA